MNLLKFFLHLIYNLIPSTLKKNTYLALKKIYIPKSKYFQHLHFKGFFKENFINSRSITELLPNTNKVSFIFNLINLFNLSIVLNYNFAGFLSN